MVLLLLLNFPQGINKLTRYRIVLYCIATYPILFYILFRYAILSALFISDLSNVTLDHTSQVALVYL